MMEEFMFARFTFWEVQSSKKLIQILFRIDINIIFVLTQLAHQVFLLMHQYLILIY